MDFLTKIRKISRIPAPPSTDVPKDGEIIFRDKADQKMKRNTLGKFIFKCNICGNYNISGQMDREFPSCNNCRSSVRMRSIIHILSVELFGVSIPLIDFPQRLDITGLGISDWDGYARILSQKTGYTNTFFDTDPKLDIPVLPGTCIPGVVLEAPF